MFDHLSSVNGIILGALRKSFVTRNNFKSEAKQGGQTKHQKDLWGPATSG